MSAAVWQACSGACKPIVYPAQACYVAIGWRTQQQQPATAGNASLMSDQGTNHIQHRHRILISNVQDTLYPSGEFDLDPSAALPASCPGWLRYVHAAYKVCAQHDGLTKSTSGPCTPFSKLCRSQLKWLCTRGQRRVHPIGAHLYHVHQKRRV